MLVRARLGLRDCPQTAAANIWLDFPEMAALLLEFGADPNQQSESHQSEHGMLGGNTSLHEAVYKGSAKMVKLLLAHGADPDIVNADGGAILTIASVGISHLLNAD